MLTQIRQLGQSTFVRNVAIVATGTAGAQAITMAYAPIITRVYGPEAFGLLGTFMAILGVLTPIAALAYPIAIVLPRSDADAKGIAQLSARVALTIAVVAALVLLLAGDRIAEILSLQAIASFLWLIPVGMVFSAFQQILTQWLIRKKQFRITAQVAVIQALLVNSAKAGVGWFHPVGAVLITVSAIGQALHAALLWSGIRSTGTAQASVDEGTGTIRELARRHRDFPLYRAPQVVLNSLSQSLPILMLASFFGPAAAGFYTLGRTVMGVPSGLIGKSVSDVFYPRINEAKHNKENVSQLIIKATLLLAALGATPYLVVVFLGPMMFGFVFGEEWARAGEFASWLAIWFFFGFINRPSVAAIPVLSLQDFFLAFEFVSVSVRAAALYVMFLLFDDALYAISIFSLLGVFLNAFLILYVISRSKSLGFDKGGQ